jgi:outer membrane protein assembly factor BamE (lipoprotein component of BamABCDE complex)
MSSLLPVLRQLAVVILVLLPLSACQKTMAVYGQFPTPEEVAQLEPQVHNRGDVVRILGTPSHLGNFSDSRWYYVSQTRDETIKFRSKKSQQVVLELDFDDQGILQAMQAYTLVDGVRVVPSGDRTVTFGRNATLLEEVLGSIGRFGSKKGTPGSIPGKPGGR